MEPNGLSLQAPLWNHDHTFSGTTDASSSLPPYLEVIFIQKD